MKIFQRLKTVQFRTSQSLPVVSTPYQQALKKTQQQYFWIILVSGLALGYYSYVYTQQRAQALMPVSIVVASQFLPMGHTLTLSDLELRQFPQSQVPVTAFTNRESLVGKSLRQSVTEREILVGVDVSAQQNPKSITAQFVEDFAFSVSEDWLVAPIPALAAGDRVDVLVTNPKATDDLTVNLATNLAVIAIEKNRNRKNLIVQVDPAQAQALLSSRGLRLPMQILVHSTELSKPLQP